MAYPDGDPGPDDPSSTGPQSGFDPGAGGGLRDAAQQVWLAGLGAFAKAQQEGGRVFEALVREGAQSQRRTQEAAPPGGEAAAAAGGRTAGFAGDFGRRASGQWDKLEEIFEARVSQALARLGVPTARELAALQARVAALEAQLLAQGQPPHDR